MYNIYWFYRWEQDRRGYWWHRGWGSATDQSTGNAGWSPHCGWSDGRRGLASIWEKRETIHVICMNTLRKTTYGHTRENICYDCTQYIPIPIPCLSSTNSVMKINFLDNLFENAEWNVCWFFWNKMTADYMYTLISFTWYISEMRNKSYCWG